jgi:hypothetical protein
MRKKRLLILAYDICMLFCQIVYAQDAGTSSYRFLHFPSSYSSKDPDSVPQNVFGNIDELFATPASQIYTTGILLRNAIGQNLLPVSSVNTGLLFLDWNAGLFSYTQYMPDKLF